jgi:hypothetical protein
MRAALRKLTREVDQLRGRLAEREGGSAESKE